MKWLRTLVLFDRGGVIDSPSWSAIHESYLRSIASIENPRGSGQLTLRRITRRPDGQWNRNGVGYLRQQFLKNLVNTERWQPEAQHDLAKKLKPATLKLYPQRTEHTEPVDSEFGGFDFVTTIGVDKLHVAIEWETGNISSSHRSLNKLAIALENGAIGAGILIVPSRHLYRHLTDRIGNIQELSGYLAMWHGIGRNVKRGLLAISVVEHDELTEDRKVPYLKIGKDGRAKEGKAKRKRSRKLKT